MASGLVTQRRLAEIIGWSRLQRLRAAGWLEPVKRSPSRVLFSPRDIHLALSRLEREACPPNQIESQRVRAWEQRTGNGYKKVPARKRPGLDAIELDFSAL
jgi:hypothetical protein